MTRLVVRLIGLICGAFLCLVILTDAMGKGATEIASSPELENSKRLVDQFLAKIKLPYRPTKECASPLQSKAALKGYDQFFSGHHAVGHFDERSAACHEEGGSSDSSLYECCMKGFRAGQNLLQEAMGTSCDSGSSPTRPCRFQWNTQELQIRSICKEDLNRGMRGGNELCRPPDSGIVRGWAPSGGRSFFTQTATLDWPLRISPVPASNYTPGGGEKLLGLGPASGATAESACIWQPPIRPRIRSCWFSGFFSAYQTCYQEGTLKEEMLCRFPGKSPIEPFKVLDSNPSQKLAPAL